ncbi:MAG: macro domain-containing protein [Acidobacteria bacterium]|nr:macro domain-containing protein [Acidobacteriota bacterium]
MSEVKAEHQLSSGHVIKILHGDITQEPVDVIVNAANSHLAHGGGVAAAIARKGGPVIQQESGEWVRQHGPVPTGDAALTGAGLLPCKAVIHAVGPIWRGGQEDEEAKLRSAVWRSLELAHQQGFQSIALPAISAGIFGFPVDRGAQILLTTAREFAQQFPSSSLRDIRFVLFDSLTLMAFEQRFRLQFGG